jgi:hypothetical protein
VKCWNKKNRWSLTSFIHKIWRECRKDMVGGNLGK